MYCIVHGVTKSRTQLSDFHFHFPFLCSLLLKSGSWVLVLLYLTVHSLGFPCGSDRKESACNARDPGLIPGSERSPGEGNGNPHQYSCLENSMGRGACWTTYSPCPNCKCTQLFFLSYQFFVVWCSQSHFLGASTEAKGLRARILACLRTKHAQHSLQAVE